MASEISAGKGTLNRKIYSTGSGKDDLYEEDDSTVNCMNCDDYNKFVCLASSRSEKASTDHCYLLQSSLKAEAEHPISASFSVVHTALVRSSERHSPGLPDTLGSAVQPAKVFNPEAYCEFCQKELCNKYYLQTHRATKHGLPIPGSLTGPSRSTSSSVCVMSSGLANAQQPPQTSIPALNFAGFQSTFAGAGAAAGLVNHNQQSAMDMQQLMLALDPNFGNNHFRAYYLSQLAALSGQGSQSLNDQSLPSSSSAGSSSSSTATSSAAPVATSSVSPHNDIASQSSKMDPQATLNAISMAGLTGGNTSDPSPTPGTTTSQTGESSVPSAAASGDLPNWLSNFFPNMNSAASAANVLQASANPLTAATSGIPNFIEQMQLISAAQMMSSGLGTGGNPISAPPLNALAAALNQPTASAGAPPLTPTGTGALFPANANYNSPSKESYCDLCDKTFCNRYFLKTHRQKKHGIVSEAQSPVKSFPSSPSALSNLPLTQPVSSLGASASTSSSLSAIPFPANLNALMAACSAASSIPLQSTALNTAQSTSVIVNSADPCSPPGKIPKLESQENECGHGQPEEVVDDAEKPLSKDQTTSESEPSLSNEIVCNLCNRSFDSLFAVVSHKAQDHPPLGANAAANQSSSQGQSSPAKGASPAILDGKVACELCDKEFESRQYLQQHILLQHYNMGGNTGLSSSLLLGSLPLPFMLPSSIPQNFQMPDVNQPNLLAAGMNNQFSQPKQAVKRQYSSTEKNYCDLCNKNLCNKYFLRTHMFKMHKIVIDENKTVIANVDTLEEEKSGVVSFRCDVCGVDVKTRHELRSHKQDAHGVVPIQTPPAGQSRTPKHSTSSTPNLATTNHLSSSGHFMEKLNAVENKTEQCPFCEYKGKTPTQLHEHLQDKHTQPSPELFQSWAEKMNLLSAIQQPESTSGHSCSFCPEIFGDQFQLQTHTVSKHAAEVCLQVNATNMADDKSVTETEQSDTDLLKCPHLQCSFRTLSGESLQLHLERHTPLDGAMAKMREQTVAALAFMQQKNVEALSAKMDEEEDEAMEATTAVALQMAKANEEKPFSCPVASCQRRYHDRAALEKHIAKVHQWQYKMSPKKPSNGVIARSKLVKLTKRYSCLFPKCQQRFLTRQLCQEHVSTVHRATDQPQTSGFEEDMDSYVREEEEHVIKNLHDQLSEEVQKEHEQHSHTSGSMSPTSENMPEGFARSLDSENRKPYLMQSFIMRKNSQDSEPELLQEVLVHLPVRAPIDRRLKTTIELIPASDSDTPLKRI